MTINSPTTAVCQLPLFSGATAEGERSVVAVRGTAHSKESCSTEFIQRRVRDAATVSHSDRDAADRPPAQVATVLVASALGGRAAIGSRSPARVSPISSRTEATNLLRVRTFHVSDINISHAAAA